MTLSTFGRIALFALAVALPLAPPARAAALRVGGLRCEYLSEPRGLDVTPPRLSWRLESDRRGEAQSAYQVLVASTPERLRLGYADLWDSGRVKASETIHIEYSGRPLASRMRCYWRVRVWGLDGSPSRWSAPASWTMGLLESGDWRAQWIADGASIDLAQAQSAGPHNGYHSELAASAQVSKWVGVDLGRLQPIQAVALFPARPYDWQPDTPGFLFPLRLRIEAASNPDFADATTVIDRTAADQPNPGTNAQIYTFDPLNARYVRVVATRLRPRAGNDYGVALAEMQVLNQITNVALGKTVLALDSIESGGWSRRNLVDGRTLPQASGTTLASKPAVMFRKEFVLDQPPRRAIAYVTGLGLYELRINGRRVGQDLLTPEWTSYGKRVQYQIYDVTKLLQKGNNAAASLVGEGWYMGRLMGIPGNAYGNYARFLLQLEIEWPGGHTTTLVTDQSWSSSTRGPIRASGIYDGETFDAQLEPAGWDQPGFGLSKANLLSRSSTVPGDWRGVRVVGAGPAKLVWQRNEPIRVTSQLTPISVAEPKPGVYVFDFGQNMVGWCRLKVKGAPGTLVTLRHAEMVNEDGTIYTANLRGAPQVDRFTLKGGAEEILEPRFTYHGFRYVELTGLAERPNRDTLLGRVFHSAAPLAGGFECSNPEINRLMRNVLWTQRANLMSSPNDCPQRDERFGWMGDIQAFAQTAIFNMDMAAFFTKWLQDVRDDQADDGRFPDYAPHPGDRNGGFSGAPAWADAGVIVPWRVYQNYADSRLLAEHFDAARRWVDYVHRLNPDLVWRQGRGNDYNDWLNGDWVRQKGWPETGGSVPKEVFATAFFAHSAGLVAQVAGALGQNEEAIRYGKLAADIRRVFNEKFVRPDGRIEGDTQAGYALALNFDLLPEEQRSQAARYLVENIGLYQNHLSTGIQSTHRAMLELTRYGHNDTAALLLTNRTFPSWGYMLENGATTIWERWDGYVKGRGFQDPGMNSFNHWAFGAVGEWVWRHLAGINPDEASPGFKHIVIRPRPCAGLTWVNASYDSIRGTIRTSWRLDHGKYRLQVRIPPNTTATVFVPTADPASVRIDGRPATQIRGVRAQVPTNPAVAQFEIASGTYEFAAVAGELGK